jgi:anti-sigma factor RsiW
VTCKELVGFLIDYLDGELSAAERRTFDEHVAECPDCVAYLDSYRKAVRLGKSACRQDGAVPSDVPEDLVRAVIAAQNRSRK